MKRTSNKFNLVRRTTQISKEQNSTVDNLHPTMNQDSQECVLLTNNNTQLNHKLIKDTNLQLKTFLIGLIMKDQQFWLIMMINHTRKH